MGAGRRILRGVAVATTVGGFVFDFNRTHLFNPRWTPHAKFHDALTISLGVLMGSSSLYFLRDAAAGRASDRDVGTLLPAMFWGAQGAAFLFPGAEGLQSEFPNRVPRIKGVWINERFASAITLTVIATGYLLDRRDGSRQPA